MNNKFKAFFVGAPLTALYILSFNRDEYIREVVHYQCNAAVKGFFNKTATSSGWNCVQNGEVMHQVGLKASMIPSPVQLTVFLVSVYVLWRLLVMIKEDYNYRGEYTLEEQLQNLKDKIKEGGRE